MARSSFTKSLIGTTIVVIALLAVSCSSDGEKKKKIEVDMSDVENADGLKSSIQSARQIFYSLPSPLETAMILKRAGAKYNEQILNPVENISKYTTNKSMALNLGIYSTNLSYASLFDQTQASIKYMAASKKMAENLGILNAIDNTVIQRLEENVNNREVIMDIISETFLSTNSILEENDRVAIGSIILVGGWIEGLYIATSLVDNLSVADNELIDRIVDQKLSLGTVLKLLEQHASNPDVRDVTKDILELKAIYDQIQISSSQVEAVQQGGVTTLRSQNVVTVTPDTFQKLKQKVQAIRKSYTL